MHRPSITITDISRQSSARTPEPNRARRTVVALTFALYIMILLEGVVQKWIFPQGSQIIPYAKDIVLVAMYVFSASMVHKAWQSKKARSWLIASILFAILFTLTETLHAHSSLIDILKGLRFYVLVPPLAWVIALQADARDVKRFVQASLLISLPIAVLVVLQHNSPAGSPINALSDPKDMQFMLADKVRTTGTFVYTKAQAMFIGLLSACLLPCLLANKQNRPLNWTWMSVACCSAFVCLCLNGNRTAFFLVFLVTLGVLAALFCQSWAYRRSAKTITLSLGLVCCGTIGVILLFQVLFPNTAQALLTRQAHQETLLRAFTEFGSGIPWELFEADPLGRGVGTHLSGTVATTRDDNAASQASGYNRKYFAENEWGRVIDEAGIFGIIFLAARVLLAVWLVSASLAAARRCGNCLPAAFSFLVAALLVTQMITFQETYAYLTWFLVGISMVANRLGLNTPVANRWILRRSYGGDNIAVDSV